MSATLSPLTVVTGITIMVRTLIFVHTDGSVSTRVVKPETFDTVTAEWRLDRYHWGAYRRNRDAAIRDAYLTGVSLRNISRMVGMSPAQVCRIVQPFERET